MIIMSNIIVVKEIGIKKGEENSESYVNLAEDRDSEQNILKARLSEKYGYTNLTTSQSDPSTTSRALFHNWSVEEKGLEEER
ncbi:hypothetical protein Glove_114g171 [Diversispora epigaea]|uniref:Uncharacterized protein n=1 Tax=Diversispora epigaea TaxID=1348612 RepID=A0A397J1K3_9GLOM|nr:hypothetical protein Glove_114g171 [Diversispora epigaea]